MTSQLVTINARKFDGRIHRSWSAELLSREGSLLMFLGRFEKTVDHPELGHIEAGTLSYEYYWLDRWYNVFRFESPAGVFRNFYCNINMPPEFSGNTLDYVDLDIDVLISSDLRHEILDRDEFQENVIRYGYGEGIVEKAETSLDEVINLFLDRRFPFEAVG